MLEASYIVLGGTGLIGSAVRAHLERQGELVISVNSKNYTDCLGAWAKVLINCNGNTFRYRANQDPRWDFEASVVSVERSLFDFRFDLYRQVGIFLKDFVEYLNSHFCQYRTNCLQVLAIFCLIAMLFQEREYAFD